MVFLRSITLDSFKVLSMDDLKDYFETHTEEIIPGFVLRINLQRYPNYYIYNIIIPVSAYMQTCYSI